MEEEWASNPSKSFNFDKANSARGLVIAWMAKAMRISSALIFGLVRKMGFKLIKAFDRLKLRIEKAEEFQTINQEKSIYWYTFFDSKNIGCMLEMVSFKMLELMNLVNSNITNKEKEYGKERLFAF